MKRICLGFRIVAASIAMVAGIQKGAIAVPNAALIKAVKQNVPQVILDNPDFLDRTEYFIGEVDLNGDGVKEAIVVLASPRCGVSECSASVYQKVGRTYQEVGGFAVQSNNAAIGVLKSKHEGWSDLAAQVYLRSGSKTVWKRSTFDGSSYAPTFEDTNQPGLVVLRIKRGKGYKLN
jgi:hypothetical protein